MPHPTPYTLRQVFNCDERIRNRFNTQAPTSALEPNLVTHPMRVWQHFPDGKGGES
jgi:hypothetical protein